MYIFMVKSKRSYIGKDKYGICTKSTKIDGDYIFMTEKRAIDVAEDAIKSKLIQDYEIITGTLSIND